MKIRFIDSIMLLKNSCLKMEEEIIERFSISPSEYRGLLVIEPGEVITGNVFSKKMGLSISRGSRVIEKLIKSGYLQQKDCEDDRRCNLVSLTVQGKKVRREIDKMLDECEDALSSKISKNELSHIKNTFEKLTNILNSNIIE